MERSYRAGLAESRLDYQEENGLVLSGGKGEAVNDLCPAVTKSRKETT